MGVGDDLLKQARPLAEDLHVGERLVVQRAVGPVVVIIEQVARPEKVLVHVPAGHAPAVAGPRGGHPDPRGDAVEREVVEHLVVAVIAVVVVDVQEVQPHLGHLVEDEPPILPRIAGGRLGEVRPGQEAADRDGRPLALIDLDHRQRRLPVRQHVAAEVEADAVVVLQQSVDAVEAAHLVGADDGQRRLAAQRNRLQHVSLRAGVGVLGSLDLPFRGQPGDQRMVGRPADQEGGTGGLRVARGRLDGRQGAGQLVEVALQFPRGVDAPWAGDFCRSG